MTRAYWISDYLYKIYGCFGLACPYPCFLSPFLHFTHCIPVSERVLLEATQR